ncbi:MAG: energy transducer TonB [Betaproteobacteria bacterium]
MATFAVWTALIVPVELSIDRGGVTIVAVMAPATETDDSVPWHVHAPAIPEDHHHEQSTAVLLHRHEPLEPSRVPIARERQTVVVTLPTLNLMPPVDTSLAVNVSVRMPRAEEEPPRLESPPIERPFRRNSSNKTPVIEKPVEMPSLASAVAEEAGAMVDELPQKLHTNPAPPYPSDAYARRQEGRVLLEVRVDARGEVAEIRVSQSSGVPALDRAALETVKAWRFQPARQGGQAIAFTINVPIRFTIRAGR